LKYEQFILIIYCFQLFQYQFSLLYVIIIIEQIQYINY